MDTLRERGDIFVAHESAGCPPVLVYDYRIILDAATLPEPCNYRPRERRQDKPVCERRR